MDDYQNVATRVRLRYLRCYECGRWWAHEPERAGTCPVCAEAKIERARAEADALKRSNAALRGARHRRG